MPMVAAGAALALWLCGVDLARASGTRRRGGGVRGAAVLAAAFDSVVAVGGTSVVLCEAARERFSKSVSQTSVHQPTSQEFCDARTGGGLQSPPARQRESWSHQNYNKTARLVTASSAASSATTKKPTKRPRARAPGAPRRGAPLGKRAATSRRPARAAGPPRRMTTAPRSTTREEAASVARQRRPARRRRRRRR